MCSVARGDHELEGLLRPNTSVRLTYAVPEYNGMHPVSTKACSITIERLSQSHNFHTIVRPNLQSQEMIMCVTYEHNWARLRSPTPATIYISTGVAPTGTLNSMRRYKPECRVARMSIHAALRLLSPKAHPPSGVLAFCDDVSCACPASSWRVLGSYVQCSIYPVYASVASSA